MPSTAPTPPHRVTWWLAATLLAGHAAMATFVATRCFPHGVSTEADGYHIVAQDLLAGRVNGDGFHPLLFPLLAAPLAALLGDALIACRLVSVAAAVVFVVASMRLAGRLGGPGARVWTFALLLPNPVLATLAPQSASDVLAAAATALALERLATWFATQERRAFAGAALAAGVAAAVRVQGTVVPLVVALAGGFAPGSLRVRAARLGAVGLGWLVAHVPQWTAHWLSGQPFLRARTETVFALKYLGHWDSSAIVGLEPGAGWSRMLQQWPEVVRWWAADAWSCLTDELPRMVTGVALPVPLALSVAAALVWVVVRSARRSPAGGWAAAFALGHVAIVALAFRPDPRVLLPILCPCLALLGAALPAVAVRWPAVCGLAVACALPGAFAHLAEQDAAPEVALARRLQDERHPAIVGSTWLLMRNELPVPTFYLVPPAGPLAANEAWARVRDFLGQFACDHVVVGAMSSPHLYQALREGPPPADVRVLAEAPGVLAIAFAGPPGSGGALEVAAAPGADGSRRVLFRGGLGGDDPPVRVGLLVVGPSGARQLLELQRVDDGWATTWTPPALAATWHLAVYGTTRGGQVLHGPEVDFVGSPR